MKEKTFQGLMAAGGLLVSFFTGCPPILLVLLAVMMLDYVTGQNPQAQIAAIVNTDLADGMAEGMQQACEHYGVQCILLHDISKVCGHPDRQGMRQIAEQVDAALG